MRNVVDTLSSTIGLGGNVKQEIEAAFERTWEERGPIGSAMHDEYLAFARSRIAALAAISDGHVGTGIGDILIPLSDGSLRLARPIQKYDVSGRLHLRFVMLKRPSLDHVKGLATRLLASAAHAVAGDSCAVELAFVEGGVDAVARTSAERATDIAEAGQVLGAIQSGDLPAIPELRTCLRCGHFHSCPATGSRRAGRSDPEN